MSPTFTLPYSTPEPEEETPEQAYARTHDENGHALFGEVIYTRPSPAEYEQAARELERIRHKHLRHSRRHHSLPAGRTSGTARP